MTQKSQPSQQTMRCGGEPSTRQTLRLKLTQMRGWKPLSTLAPLLSLLLLTSAVLSSCASQIPHAVTELNTSKASDGAACRSWTKDTWSTADTRESIDEARRRNAARYQACWKKKQ